MSSLNAPNTTSSSSLRPRNRRLISGLEEQEPAKADVSGNFLKTSPFASPFGSRSTSPLPKTGLTRTPSSQQTTQPSAPSERALSFGRNGDALSSISGFWGNSWSSIQGLASNVLGNDSDTPVRRGKLSTFDQPKRASSSVPPSKWGVSTAQAQDIGVGTKEERENMVRAMKRRDLLSANGHMYQDTVGRFKRRNSDERMSSSAPPGEGEDRDALVYVHHVKPSDTLAGLTIKYNCAAAVLQKANRMWPNDSVQVRKKIVLPVDACGVKGRRCTGPEDKDEDLLGHDEESKTIKDTNDNGWLSGTNSSTRRRTDTIISNPTASTASNRSDSEPPWIHDSWVMLPHDEEPIEIARLPRRTLGFFPPARRKSLTLSDSDTPSPSLDLPRSLDATATSPQRSTQDASSVTSSPPPIRPIRTRKHSISQGFSLQGPGGVGTLGKNIRAPGPGEDAFNKFVAQHLPSLQPPPGQEHSIPWAPSMLEQAGEGSGPVGYSAVSRQGGFDFEQVGGAIETWMRKTAAKVSASINEQANTNSRRFAPVPGLAAEGGGLGDLIELRDDAFEIGDDEEDILRGRPSTIETTISTDTSSARPDLPTTMKQRESRAGGSKGGKGD
ncbi:hypothetical protein EJ05DRAFT_472151 [Pseudovirgaria hyperparasitica]|uniref:LysM domain-containing protein n=1 Tax=Pseudovirgaria hyperparasitica TaxID=470096 RepID=A0A6A6WM05_9PEZI|nr:uncharacterized protein EJ05DRAFT_472151 [Pseudovirgaria hyperparasitica]KAF2763237.1 hypothetical protein EJ05DRAFT_472151 [Pseudovirgaria hyperparasitica]